MSVTTPDNQYLNCYGGKGMGRLAVVKGTIYIAVMAAVSTVAIMEGANPTYVALAFFAASLLVFGVEVNTVKLANGWLRIDFTDEGDSE